MRISEAGRGGVAMRLAARRTEIEAAALTRVQAIADPIEAADPEYADGLRRAVSAALDYALAAIASGEEHAPPVPGTLLAQARLAARNGVSLDTVLRRYFAGYTLFADFFVQEVEADGTLGGGEVQRLLQTHSVILDRLVVSVTEEYRQESESRPRSTEEHRTRRVRRLLDGELIDPASLAYELDAWHLGLVAIGADATSSLRGLARQLDRRLLLVRPGDEAVWAWLGGRRRLPAGEVVERAADSVAGLALLAVGEPGEGVGGWRLSHRQAIAAFGVARRGSAPIVRYADTALLAAVLGDDVLSASLRQLYLAPLAAGDDGPALLETLRVYFSSDGHVTSTAAALGVTRRTVSKRLRAVEERLGRSIEAAEVELRTALRLSDLEGGAGPGSTRAR